LQDFPAKCNVTLADWVFVVSYKKINVVRTVPDSHKYKTRTQVSVLDKHIRLLHMDMNYTKKFYNTEPWVQYKNFFTAVTNTTTFKLEWGFLIE